MAANHDMPSPEIVELTGATTELGPGRATAWLACGAVVLTVVVGLGVAGRMGVGVGSSDGPVPGDPASAPGGPTTVSQATVPHDAGPSPRALGPTPGSSGRPPQQIVILLPAPGEVILGGLVPVAGRIEGSGPPRGMTPETMVHVAIAAGNTTFGEADLPVDGGRFAGWVEVTVPVRGRVVEVRAWDALRLNVPASIQTVVLGAKRSASEAR